MYYVSVDLPVKGWQTFRTHSLRTALRNARIARRSNCNVIVGMDP